jgi:hypothetical protein
VQCVGYSISSSGLSEKCIVLDILLRQQEWERGAVCGKNNIGSKGLRENCSVWDSVLRQQE